MNAPSISCHKAPSRSCPGTTARLFALLIAGLAPSGALADKAENQVRIERPIIAAAGAIAGADVAAYALFVNSGADNAILEARCDCAETVELHLVDRGQSGRGMVNALPLPLPAGARTEISPPGIPRHMMAMGLKTAMAKGDKVTLHFRLASGEWISGQFDAVDNSSKAWQNFEDIDTGIAQLRHAAGNWRVTTRFFGADGKESATVAGSYLFEWVVEDRILRGTSRIASLGLTSAMLFYIRPSDGSIEMLSVGQDGAAWTMTGPIGAETRETTEVAMADGTKLKLRFTRFNIVRDRYESRMERSTDGGVTWALGNHQIFERQAVD